MINILNKFGQVFENVDLKKYNTYRVSAYAKYLIVPTNLESLQKLLKYVNEENIKHMIIGNGSNLIFCDTLYDGVIIKLDNFKNIEINENKVVAEAGVMLPNLVNITVTKSLKGLEWAAGIPGTVGGSVVGNAGAYKSDIFEFIEDITVLDKFGNINVLKKDDIKHGYRYTEFKDKYKDVTILSVTLNLEFGNKEESLDIIEDRRNRRMASQPLEYPSAGSVFRNPDGDSAGRIIEQEIGFKGKKMGDAEVSKKHANFIINTGNATGSDIKALIELIHKEVLEKTKIDLIVEQEFIN